MENSKKKESVAFSSVIASGFLTVLKLMVGVMTGSMGIISEAIHSLLDLGAAILTFFAVRFGDRPPDKDHPYGHGKIESVSALIETGLLFITSAWIIYEAVHRLMFKNVEVEATWYAFAVIIISIVVDISRSRALSKIGKETRSQALEADALHFSSDILSSLVVLIGLVFVFFGISGADSLAAIGVSLFVALAGYRLGKRTINVLLDAAPEGISEKAKEIAEKIEGVIAVELVRSRLLGPNSFIEMVIQIDRKMSMVKVQKIINNIEKEVEKDIPSSDISVRTRSIHLDNENINDSIHALAGSHNISIHEVAVDDLGGCKCISYHVEISDSLNAKEAHKIANELEMSIKEELGEQIIINSHIEPFKNNTILSQELMKKDEEEIVLEIKKISVLVKDLNNLHSFVIRKIDNGYFISLHCVFLENMTLENVHNAVSELESLIKDKIKEVRRIIIHAEPE
ncbi:MAG: cation diffusion facilitator family transporter [Candidatus Paceibacterota bacterium]|jgi:cation diffusion facilitator family transporter